MTPEAGPRPTLARFVGSLRRLLPAAALFLAAMLTGVVAARGPVADAPDAARIHPPLALAAVSVAPVLRDLPEVDELLASLWAAPVAPPLAPASDAAPALAIHRASEAPAVAEPAEPSVVIEGSIPAGGTLASALASQQIGASTVHVIATEMAPVFNFRYARAGDRYRLEKAEDGRLLSFRYSRSDLERYDLARDGDAWLATRHEPVFVRARTRIAGIVSTSLYDAIEALGERTSLARDFANIFAWDVDFSRGAQPGDAFSIVYERLMLQGEDGAEDSYVRPGRILAARYTTRGDEFRAVYFEHDESRGGYYRPDGSAVERHFLRAPLQYSRISSQFSMSRMHPILKVRRPHPGIDYAAPRGTPVWSVADGVVVHRGYTGGYGHLVKVRHANGYVTYYGHLSRYEAGVDVGDRVHQKQVIGYVGATGLATGPHLDYRIRKDGRFVNPSTLRMPAGDPIPPEAQPRFAAARDGLLSELDPPTLVVVSEAL